jgi:hypothetical protein
MGDNVMSNLTPLVSIGLTAILAGQTLIAQGTATPVAVYKEATCGCCVQWVEHLNRNGFAATATNRTDMDAVKAQNHVPPLARSCHTARVGAYVIEGHVPASDIRRLLKERPTGIIGLAVAGMPIGSPGMEVPGTKAQSYDVLAFDKAGNMRVFASH